MGHREVKTYARKDYSVNVTNTKCQRPALFHMGSLMKALRRAERAVSWEAAVDGKTDDSSW